MNNARRFFIKILSQVGLFVVFGTTAPKAAKRNQEDEKYLQTLVSYIDALVPSDDVGPGAIELGVHLKIIRKAKGSKRYQAVLERGCKWLDLKAKKFGGSHFGDLSPAKRDEVIAAAADSEINSLPRVFFQTTRNDVYFHYYAEPEAWVAMGYQGPPQPEGFADYASPSRLNP